MGKPRLDGAGRGITLSGKGKAMTEKTADLIGKAIDLFFAKPIVYFTISATCFVIVLLPAGAKDYLGISQIVAPYRGWVALAGIASGVIWVASCSHRPLDIISKWARGKYQLWHMDRKGPRILRELSRQEKRYIADYIKNDVTTKTWNCTNGVINGLQLKGVVYQASNISGLRTDYNLKPWVTRAIQKNPDLKEDILKHYVEVV